jgi:hypothetical protein
LALTKTLFAQAVLKKAMTKGDKCKLNDDLSVITIKFDWH